MPKLWERLLPGCAGWRLAAEPFVQRRLYRTAGRFALAEHRVDDFVARMSERVVAT